MESQARASRVLRVATELGPPDDAAGAAPCPAAPSGAAGLESAIAASDAGKFDVQYRATLRKAKGAKDVKPNVIDSAKAKQNGAARHA